MVRQEENKSLNTQKSPLKEPPFGKKPSSEPIYYSEGSGINVFEPSEERSEKLREMALQGIDKKPRIYIMGTSYMHYTYLPVEIEFNGLGEKDPKIFKIF